MATKNLTKSQPSDGTNPKKNARISLWKFGGLTPLAVIKRVVAEIDHDDVWGRSASLSYYFLLALFPALLFMVSLLGMFAGPGTALREGLFQNVARVLPASASELVAKTVTEVHQASGLGKILFGLLTALWAASGGMSAIITTLNICYDVTETRPWWKQKLTAIGLTIGISALVIVAITITLYGGQLAEWIGGKLALGSAAVMAWKVIQWPIALLAMLVVFAGIYYFAPNLNKPEWYWISPGASVGLFLWVVASMAFRIYLQFFNTYSKTYGSLGAVIILMLWFYLTAFSILMGGEVNSEITHATVAANEHAEYMKKIQEKRAA
jgi:membrane protein